MRDLTKEEYQDLVVYEITRLDGAWFRFVSEKIGMEAAVDIDAKVWQDWMMRVTRKIKKVLEVEGTTYDAIRDYLPKIEEIQGRMMGIEGELIVEDEKLISRVNHCEYWENIKKAGLDQFAEAGIMCSKVHEAGYRGIMEGVLPGTKYELKHTRRIPDGSPCCEVIIHIHP